MAKPDELSGGTFTITNIGSQGALFDLPGSWFPPQAPAMLGTGRSCSGRGWSSMPAAAEVDRCAFGLTPVDL